MEDIDNDWRNDPGLAHTVAYKKRFALFPKTCEDGTVVWLDNYYTKYKYWGFKGTKTDDNANMHADKCESVTEAEYIVRKLIEGV